MDIECDRIRIIKDNKNMEYFNVPTCFFEKDKKLIIDNIFLYLNELVIKNDKKNLDGCIENLILIIYCIIDRLVEQGIYPDTILNLMIYDDLQKVWSDNKKHYDKHGKSIYPNGYKSISKSIDEEVLAMKNGNYKKCNVTISKQYGDILDYFKLVKEEFNENLSCLKKDEIVSFQTKICNLLIRYLNCDYVEEEAEFLVSSLYETMKICAKMGINPDEYLNKLIDEIMAKSLKNKSK